MSEVRCNAFIGTSQSISLFVGCLLVVCLLTACWLFVCWLFVAEVSCISLMGSRNQPQCLLDVCDFLGKYMFSSLSLLYDQYDDYTIIKTPRKAN